MVNLASFWKLKFAVKQCYQTGHFKGTKIGEKPQNYKCDILSWQKLLKNSQFWTILEN